MTNEQQIKALAKLDGWSGVQPNHVPRETMMGMPPNCERFELTKPYLTSYDAIIPLVQKQSYEVRNKIFSSFEKDTGWTAQALLMLAATPAQLCEALLRATGKWVE